MVTLVPLQNGIGNPPGRSGICLQGRQASRLFFFGYLEEKLEDHRAAIIQLALEGPNVGIGFFQFRLVELIFDLRIKQVPVPTPIENSHPVGRRGASPKPPEKGSHLLITIGRGNATYLEPPWIHWLDHPIDDGALPRRAQSFDHNEHGNPQFPAFSLQIGQFLARLLNFLT